MANPLFSITRKKEARVKLTIRFGRITPDVITRNIIILTATSPTERPQSRGLLLAILLLASTPASGETHAAEKSGASSDTVTARGNDTDTAENNGAAGDFDNLLFGDMRGLRPALKSRGITLTLQETSEYLGNLSGGVHRGFQYNGLTTLGVQIDTEKAFGLTGGQIYLSGLQIHGTNLSEDNLKTLQTASGIHADRATRLWEAWFEQQLMDGALGVKLGQQSLDQEFMLNTNAGYFINTMFGWPMLPTADLPAGGAAYPLAALGLRLSVKPIDGLTLLGGVFSATPVSNPEGDPQKRNRNGTDFPLGRGTMSIVEMQLSAPAGKAEKATPDWTYRLGAWYNTHSFDDQRFDETGRSLSDPSSNGIPREHKGNFSFYIAADQVIWRDRSAPERSISVLARFMKTPFKDRNLIDADLLPNLVRERLGVCG